MYLYLLMFFSFVSFYEVSLALLCDSKQQQQQKEARVISSTDVYLILSLK